MLSGVQPHLFMSGSEEFVEDHSRVDVVGKVESGDHETHEVRSVRVVTNIEETVRE